MARSPVELIDKALTLFKQNPGPIQVQYILADEVAAQIPCIQEINLKKDDRSKDTPKGKFYAYCWTSDQESKYLKTKLSDCAKLGLVVAVSRPLYQEMKSQDIRKARIAVKEFTRHNDKLGFDFSVTSGGYYASSSTQFKESAYGGPKGFLSEAVTFYEGKGLKEEAAHFQNMSTKYTMSASSGARQAFTPTDDIQYERRIEGYIDEINRLEYQANRSAKEVAMLEDQLESSRRTIRGYDDHVVLAPHQVIDYPAKLRHNIRKMLQQIQTTDETRYMKSLLDPFHPDSLGVRVPSRVPRSTITYNTHSEYTFRAQTGSTEALVISNFEQISGDKFVAITGEAVNKFLTNTPQFTQSAQVYTRVDDQIYDVTYVNIGLLPAITVQHDDTWFDNFFKMRCVAGGMRCIKTSRQDSESGSLDMIYSRDGSSFDEGHSFKSDLARVMPDRCRTYLAGSGCCMRDTNGFVIQANKRPHDEASLELLDIKHVVNSKGQNFAPHGLTSSVWFIDIDNGNGMLHRARDAHLIPSDHQVGIVLESLQSRHTIMSVLQDVQPGMSISFEMMYHMEGIADQSAYGFAQSHSAKLQTASTSLALLDSFEVDMIFAPYSVRRPQLMRQLLGHEQITGYWDETLFPGIKELVRYGADKLSGSEFLDDMIDAMVDSAAGTLGALAPQFLPAILAASGVAKDPIHNLADQAIVAAQEWSRNVGGQSYYTKYPAQYNLSVLNSVPDDQQTVQPSEDTDSSD